jgi:hypothetical protein
MIPTPICKDVPDLYDAADEGEALNEKAQLSDEREMPPPKAQSAPSGMREVLQQAVEALSKCTEWLYTERAIRHYGPNFMGEVEAALASLESALQKQLEPVAWLPYCHTDCEIGVEGEYRFDEISEGPFPLTDPEHWECRPLYASPVLHQQEVPSENHRLRMLLCEVLKALGNGSGASPECSLDFLASIPEEVRLEVARLRAASPSPTHHQEVKAQSASEAEKGGKEGIVADFVDYKPNFGGAAAILQAAANVIAVAEKERMLRIAEWRNALLETPPCDGETVFIGINSAGFACCFNEVTRDGVCFMTGPEISTVQMSGLKWWRVLDRPDTSGLPGTSNGQGEK